MLTRYQTLPSEPVALRTANISCGRKSGRKAFITLIARAWGFGVFRTTTEWTSISPAAGKADAIGGPGGGFGVVVVVGVVEVVVVPVPPASARVGSMTAAANPATARTTEAMTTGRFITGRSGTGGVDRSGRRCRRPPLRQGRADSGPRARTRLDLDRSTEEPHPLGDAGESEAVGVELARREPAPVVGHGQVDEGAPAAQHDRDLPGPAVLAHVRQCLLHDAEEHDLLRVAETREIALGLEVRLDARRALERAQLAFHCIRDGACDRRRRADGVRDLAQALVEGSEPGVDVVETPAHTLSEVVRNDRRDLGRRGAQLLGQRHDLLKWPVVQVEAEPEETPLAGSHEVVLTLHSPVEERCPFEQRRQGGRSFLEVLLEMLRLGGTPTRDERGVRAVPPLDDAHVHLGRADDYSVERGAR